MDQQDNAMTKCKRTKRQIMIYRKLHVPHKKTGVNSGAAEGYVVSAPLLPTKFKFLVI
jgi:hypothetical protein